MTTSVAGSAIVADSGSGSGIRDLNINVSVTGDVPSPSLLHMGHLIFSLLQCCQVMDWGIPLGQEPINHCCALLTHKTFLSALCG